MSWKRNQKYLPRPRHLYALFFNGGGCYVGQTVDLVQREKQHRSSRGGWQGRPFQFAPLGQMVGTQADAEVHEYAWRYKAFRKGWRIYSKPPGLLIRDPGRRSTFEVRRLSGTYAWPANAPAPGRFTGSSTSWAWRFFKWLFLYPALLGLGLMVLQALLLYL